MMGPSAVLSLTSRSIFTTATTLATLPPYLACSILLQQLQFDPTRLRHCDKRVNTRDTKCCSIREGVELVFNIRQPTNHQTTHIKPHLAQLHPQDLPASAPYELSYESSYRPWYRLSTEQEPW